MYSSIVPLLLTLAIPIAQAGQPPQTSPQDAGQPAAQRRRVVTYSDGTTSTQLLGPRGGFWKPKFPQQSKPNYKITFRNRAARAVMAVSFKMHRGEKQVGSGRRKTNRSSPIVEAPGEYTFMMTVGSGDTPGVDRFGVDGVLSDDGQVEGNSRSQCGR